MGPHARAAREMILVMLALLPPLGVAASWAAARERTRVDRDGDPLPPGAVARLVNKEKPTEVLAIAFSPDGRLLASCSPGDAERGVRLWDITRTEEARVFSEPAIRAWNLAFAPDGKVLAVTNADNNLVLWDVDAGKMILQKSLSRGTFGWQWTRRVAFSADGKTVASLAPRRIPDHGLPETVHLWETVTGEERAQIDPVEGGAISSFAFSPREPLLAIGTASDNIHLWNLAQGRFVRTLTFDGQVNTVAFSPDGAKLFAIGYADPGKDEKIGTPLRSWDAASGKPLLRLAGEDPNKCCLALSPNGRQVAIAHGNRASIRDSATGEKRAEFKARARLGINALAFSPDGKLLATADKEILLWDLSSLPAAKRADRAEKPIAVRPQSEADAKDWPREEVERCWANLAGGDAVTAYRAIWNLTRHPRQSLPLLRERLQPLRAVKPERVAELLGDLDSDIFAARQKATRELEKLDETIETALRKALTEKPSVEKRLRIKRLLGDPLHPPPEQLRVLRAVEILEHLGTPEARRILRRLSEGTPDARRTREARASLERLNRSSTAQP